MNKHTPIPRIIADFNSMQEKDLVVIGKDDSWQIVQYRPLGWLNPGARVKLYDGEIEFIGTLEYEQQTGWWLGRLDLSTRRELSSSIDGWEEFQQTLPAEKLAILRIETNLRVSNIVSVAESLMQIDPSVIQGLPSLFGVSVQSLKSTADELKEILDLLT